MNRIVLGSDDKNDGIRVAAMQAIEHIADNKPELIDLNIMNRIILGSDDKNDGIRRAAMWAIGNIALNKPNLITTKNDFLHQMR
jgi:vesicle coat complex subunit